MEPAELKPLFVAWSDKSNLGNSGRLAPDDKKAGPARRGPGWEVLLNVAPYEPT
jgi:hypothetical protein